MSAMSEKTIRALKTVKPKKTNRENVKETKYIFPKEDSIIFPNN